MSPGKASWIEPASTRLILQLEPRQITDFLLDAVEPAMARLKRDGELRGWIFAGLSGQKPPPGTRLVLYLRPTSRSTKAELSRAARALLSAPLERQNGRFRERQWDAPDLRFARERFGGDSGIRILSLFNRDCTRITLEFLRLLRDPPSDMSAYAVGLGSIAFFLEAFRISGPELLPALDRWIDYFAPKAAKPGTLPLYEEQARVEIARDPALRGLLRACAETEWRTVLPAPLISVLTRHEVRMKRIGKLLIGNEPHFSPAKPRSLVIFHSYIHGHLLRLDIGGSRELFLMLLLREWLKTPAARGGA